MRREEAIAIVSYKLGLKSAEKALQDTVLDKEVVEQAMRDQENDCVRKVDLKQYMEATKWVKQYREQLYKEENEQFLENNLQDAQVLSTESGLQYIVLKEGKGAHPSLVDQVTIVYQGTLVDGSVFDAAEQPRTYRLQKLIRGWQEGIQLMRKGAQFRFYVPQNLGYGERGMSDSIPSYSTLIFEVMLLDFELVG